LRQDTGVPAGGLGSYYSVRGEAPGMWVGAVLAGLGLQVGGPVSEAQMTALFGRGCHPVTGDALGKAFPGVPAASEFRRLVGQRIAEELASGGRPAGERLPNATRARIRTQVGRELFAAEYGRAPADAQELSSFIAAGSRLAPDTVAGYDLTFSPVKSVSALWALAGPRGAAEIAAAHQAAVADTMAWLEQHAAYTRLGHGGIRQVETRGLIAAAFTHRESRAGDPDLHTHVAVSNKVQTADGRSRALDGRVLYKAITAASERYNTRLEAHLGARLGMRFDARTTPDGKRPVREVVGVDPRLLAAWSTRRRDIEHRRGMLAGRFQVDHGRAPTAWEAITLAQQATLETRQGKPAPRSEAKQRTVWVAHAERVLGPGGTERMLAEVHAAAAIPGAVAVDPAWVERTAGQVVAVVQAQRATWQAWHVRAEAERAARFTGIPLGALDATVEAIVDTAIRAHSIPVTDPDPVEVPGELRRGDGSSVYRVVGAEQYTSAAILRAEQRLIDAAARRDGRFLNPDTVELALLEAAANGTALNDGQAQLVRDLTGSGARVQLALAPAGTGKTTALRVLARAWTDEGGTVLFLAPSAAAAAVLREVTGHPADTLAKLLHRIEHGVDPPALGPGSLVLVDEAGQAGTLDLARVASHVVDAGGSVRLIGDDRQLAAVGAGGVLRDIAATVGVVRLETPVRFANPAEAAATLALREGNPAGLDFYLDHGRVHVADDAGAVEQAYQAWAADRAAGVDALLLAGTRDLVTELNRRARADRLAGSASAEVALADGTAASTGDSVITRRNDRRLYLPGGDWVKNGDRWTVDTVAEDGSLGVIHAVTGRRVTMPADYVSRHIALGYASTIHAAQGSTAEASHTVLTGTETRQQLYVALTRGRAANHLHLALPGAGSEHAAIARDTLIPPTAVDLLHRITARDDAQHSASSQLRELADPARQLREAIARYTDALAMIPASPEPGRPSGAPLPWLPAVPATVGDPWRAYLTARAEQITQLAGDIGQRGPREAHRWASAIGGYNPQLIGDIAVWRAAHNITRGAPPDLDGLTDAAIAYHRELRQRVAENLRDAPATRRWAALAATIDPRLVTDPSWPGLAATLDRAHRAGLDVPAELPAMLGRRPLPDRQPALEAKYRVCAACPAAIAPEPRYRVPERTSRPLYPKAPELTPYHRPPTPGGPRR
jgi:conjugative relaxase-like TrwC/TraI family protein